MRLFCFAFLFLTLWQCDTPVSHSAEACHVRATVKDLTGLDGCRLVFELEDGTLLEPEMRVYVQPPLPEEDPLYYFELKAGQQVLIGYRASDAASVCMAGQMVFITCIRPADTSGT